HQTSRFQLGQIAPHTRRRGTQVRDQLVQRETSFPPQLLQDLVFSWSCLHGTSQLPWSLRAYLKAKTLTETQTIERARASVCIIMHTEHAIDRIYRIRSILP